MATATGQNGGVDSPGEQLFAAYLRQRGLSWQREPDIHGRRPDFLVDRPVMDFAAEVYEPKLRLPPGAGWFDSYAPLRRSFRGRKSRQAKAVKEAGLPFVVVLARTNSDVRFQPEIVAGAMFGNISVEVPLNSTGGESRTVFGGGGRVQRKRNRGVSAVAILSSFNPTYWRVEQVMADRLGVEPSWKPNMSPASVRREQVASARVMKEVHDHMAATGDYIVTAQLARLVVLHNPYADHPIGLEVLNGPHDVQWANTKRDGIRGYGPACWGELSGREAAKP